jgi:5-methylcytosine-specific restriction endonuclease McrA
MKTKKQIRAEFRVAVLARDNLCCRCCGKPGYDRQGEPQEGRVPLDAHHIIPRDLMPNGGYVAQNGISVCDECHLKAEAGVESGFTYEELYALIGSSEQEAIAASEELR